MTSILRILDVLLDERDREYLFPLVGASAGRGGHASVEKRIEFLENRRLGRSGFRFFTADVEMLYQVLDCRCACLMSSWHLAKNLVD